MKRILVLGLLLFMAACGDTARSFLAPAWIPAVTSDCTPWDAGTTYNGGSTVTYEGQGYEAKWWVVNRNPAQNSSQWAVWKTTDVCDHPSDDGADDGGTTDGETTDTGTDSGADDGDTDTGTDGATTDTDGGADDGETGGDDGADDGATTDGGATDGETSDTGADSGTDDGGSDDGGEGEDRIIEGDVTVNTQAELDALEGVTEITGFFQISTEAENLDFSPLDELRTVGARFGGISLSDNSALREISGFGALEKVSSFFISDNDSLKTITGFENFSEITTPAGGGIIGNAELENLPTFDSFETSYYFRISNNASLTELSGFPALTSVIPDSSGQQFEITNNDGLIVIDGFNNLSSDTLIENNQSLESITGLANVRDIRARNNESLSSITGFNETTLMFRIELDNSPLLADISGFASLDSLRFLYLTDLPALTDLSPFSNLGRVSDAAIIDNVGARSFEAFAGTPVKVLEIRNFPYAELAESAGLKIGVLEITDNPELTTLSGFNNLEEGASNLGGAGSFTIIRNPKLTTISGFNDIEAGAAALTITDNPGLTTISGFSNTDFLFDTDISENESFDCSLSPQAELGFLPVDVSAGNAVNCPTE